MTVQVLEKKMFDEVLSEWKRNYGSDRKPDYRPLCTYVRKVVHGRIRTNYDLHYVDPRLSSGGEADVAFYVLKYMMKPSDRLRRLQQALHLNLPEDEYEEIWKIVRTRHFESEGFGLGTSEYVSSPFGHRIYKIPDKVLSYLRKGIDLSKQNKDEPLPSYFSPVNGKSFPLAKYYKSRGEVFTMRDYLDFFYASQKIGADNFIPEKEVDNQTDQAIEKFEKNVSLVEFNQSVSEMDDLFDCDSQFLDF